MIKGSALAADNSTHPPVFSLNGVAGIRFPHATAGSRALTSQDGTTWREIPQLPTLSLPAGQTDGWFADSDGTIHVLTRHLTFYALVGPQASTSSRCESSPFAASGCTAARSSPCACR
jgi:hypothetical protein